MGYYKQLHIDCHNGVCEVNQVDTCYMQEDNPSYCGDNDTVEGGTNDGGDYNASIDVDRV